MGEQRSNFNLCRGVQAKSVAEKLAEEEAAAAAKKAKAKWDYFTVCLVMKPEKEVRFFTSSFVSQTNLPPRLSFVVLLVSVSSKTNSSFIL